MAPSNNEPYRQAETFPVLTPAQIARIRPHAIVRSVRVGEVLFEPGTLRMSCFVVVLGKLEISMPRLSGEQESRTDWLRECLALDERGFVLTGRDLDAVLATAPLKWQLTRPPDPCRPNWMVHWLTTEPKEP
jgi:hypothetical protein